MIDFELYFTHFSLQFLVEPVFVQSRVKVHTVFFVVTIL